MKLPNDDASERAVIGSMMFEERAAEVAVAMLTTEDFYAQHYRELFRVISARLRGNQPIDYLTIAKDLEAGGKLESIGGIGFVSGIVEGTPNAANIESYAQQVIACADKRRIVQASHEAMQAAQNGQAPAEIAEALSDATKPILDRQFGGPRPGENPSDLVRRQIEDEVNGARYSVPFPWRQVNWTTKALLPGTITILVGTFGSTKSLMMVQACLGWHKESRPIAMLELEGTRTYHLRRAMAIDIGDANLVDPDWNRDHEAEAVEAAESRAALCDTFGACIYEAPVDCGADWIAEWICSMMRHGVRIVVVDPITAKDNSEKPWVADQRLIRNVSERAKRYGASVILVSHPPGGKEDATKIVSGGESFVRFTDTVLLIKRHESKHVSCYGAMGDTSGPANTEIFIHKANNGRGKGLRIALAFDPATLRTTELGIRRSEKCAPSPG